MLNLTDHLRRLRVDRYEYVAMKVIVLLQSGMFVCAISENYNFTLFLYCILDTSELREPEKVRTSQEKALQALQAYTLSHYPETPSKFGELLLRIPELQRTCQVRFIIYSRILCLFHVMCIVQELFKLKFTVTIYFLLKLFIFVYFMFTGWQRNVNNKIKRQ